MSANYAHVVYLSIPSQGAEDRYGVTALTLVYAFVFITLSDTSFASPSNPGTPPHAHAVFHLCYRAVQIASLVLEEVGEMPVCDGRLRVELERTSEQTLRAVDVPAHVQ